MPDSQLNIDPKWAWSAYEPSADVPWTRALAAHLHRRAGFGATSAELEQAHRLGPAKAIEAICNPPAESTEFASSTKMLGEQVTAGSDPLRLAAWWLYRMLNTADPLKEKLALFWHGHFATSAAKVDKLWMMLNQNELFRTLGGGRFSELTLAISRDPAMLIYLDSTTNRRIHPNENYARELMELFTLGVGNYSEQDIKEIARAFTGWEILADAYHFDASQHDTKPKTFLGQTGNFGGEDAVRIVLEQPAAPRFIARKLVRYFVFDEPVASDELIAPLAEELRSNDFRIAPVIRRILSSNVFFSKHAVARKIRPPVDLAVGLLRSLGATTSLVSVAQGTAELGQSLFRPPNVKGWDGGRLWINSSSLLGRANFVGTILSAPETRFAGGSLSAEAARAGARTPEQIVDWLCDLLLAVPPPAGARSALVQIARPDDASIAKTIHTISALPEFQLA